MRGLRSPAFLGGASVLALISGFDASAATPPEDAGETVTVTARRRAEPLQKTPVAVTVITAKQAATTDTHDLQGILAAVPSASFRTNSSSKDRTVFVRGIGTISTSPGVEPSVSTVIDGVVMARSGQATQDLIDLQQIEVLRGPQGTLFGKNATAGAVNITTAAPTSAFHAYTDASYFSGNEYRVAAGVSGTLVENRLVANLGIMAGGFDGNVDNATLGRQVNGYAHQGFRSKLLWTPDTETRVTLGLDFLHENDPVPNGVFVSSGQIAYPTGIFTNNASLSRALASEGIAPSRNNDTVANNLDSRSRDREGGVSLTAERNLGGGATLTSITAYRRWQNTQDQDYDQLASAFAGLPQIADHGALDLSQVSEELRFQSRKGGWIDYTGGVFYLHTDDDESYDRAFGTVTGQTADGHAVFDTRTNNAAAFAEGNVNFTPTFRAILGARVIYQDVDYDFSRRSSSAVAVTGIRPGFASSGTTDDVGYVDRIGLQYDVSPNAHAYFTYSRGYQGPAYNVFFNMQKSDTGALKPETNNSFEIGLKTQALHQRLTANFAAFIEDFSNYQANFTDQIAGGLVTRLINAGSVSTKGVESDLSFRVDRHLTLGANVAYTYAAIDDFACPPGAPTSCNVNGQRLPFAPRWKAHLSADYTQPLSQRYQLSGGSTYDWQSSTQFSLAQTPGTVQGAYGIWNLYVTFADLDARWRITGILRNTLDTHYSAYRALGNLGGTVAWLGRDYGRYGGFTLHKDF